MQFVDVKNDIAFRKIFCDEGKKLILISFLNAIIQLKGKNRIADIVLGNPFQLPVLPNYKASILDVKATDANGKNFIIEMQVANLSGMDKRLLYYTSKEYSSQLVSSEKYTDLNPVIFIGIFDFAFTEGPEYLSHHAICNVVTGERVIKDMDFHFIELRKFLKPLHELDNVTDKWIYFIKEAENLEVIPENVDDEGLREAWKYANKMSWTKKEMEAYDYVAMREMDEYGRLDFAVKKAVSEAVSEAVISTERQTNMDTILKLHGKHKSAEEIADLLDISMEAVNEIIENQQP